MRVAFFGGSFDPPHLGHLRIALAAADRLQLDRVLFAPAAVQPLKRDQSPPPALYAHRLAMLQLLLEEARDSRLEISELDAPLEDGRPNYTYETVLALRAGLSPADKIFLLTGADALLTLPKWHRALDLISSNDIIVASRPGFPLDQMYASLALLIAPGKLRMKEHPDPGIKHLVLEPATKGQSEALAVMPSDVPRGTSGSSYALPAEDKESRPRANFYVLADLTENIASTGIRDAILQDSEHACLDLSARVAAYIGVHGLYR